MEIRDCRQVEPNQKYARMHTDTESWSKAFGEWIQSAQKQTLCCGQENQVLQIRRADLAKLIFGQLGPSSQNHAEARRRESRLQKSEDYSLVGSGLGFSQGNPRDKNHGFLSRFWLNSIPCLSRTQTSFKRV